MSQIQGSSKAGKLKRVAQHLSAALRDFKHVASICPSSSALARSVAGQIQGDFQSIIEYGPGTGVITKEMLKKLSPTARVIGVEINPSFVRYLAELGDPRFSVIEGDVSCVLSAVRADFPAGVDAVVSGIPFSLIPTLEREAIVEATGSTLKSGGKFIVYQVTLGLLPVLKRHFSKVEYFYQPKGLLFVMVASNP